MLPLLYVNPKKFKNLVIANACRYKLSLPKILSLPYTAILGSEADSDKNKTEKAFKFKVKEDERFGEN